MSQPQAPKPAKLVIGLFLQDRALLPEIVAHLQTDFGAIDMVSPWLAFDYTSYYASEMGTPLFRRMLVFKALIQQEALAGIKRRTNALEEGYAEAGKRRVNLDPGYLLLERFVLATGKNFTHRIYIGQGIYADLTLMFQKGAFQTLPWTYPDYAAEEMRAFLSLARQKYSAELAVQMAEADRGV
ncbi:MAG: DUF4416 family protein [Desulfobacteraceae bacterium]|nr:DUF4416 family protein [Desulfobacteraceae bacterium]